MLWVPGTLSMVDPRGCSMWKCRWWDTWIWCNTIPNVICHRFSQQEFVIFSCKVRLFLLRWPHWHHKRHSQLYHTCFGLWTRNLWNSCCRPLIMLKRIALKPSCSARRVNSLWLWHMTSNNTMDSLLALYFDTTKFLVESVYQLLYTMRIAHTSIVIGIKHIISISGLSFTFSWFIQARLTGFRISRSTPSHESPTRGWPSPCWSRIGVVATSLAPCSPCVLPDPSGWTPSRIGHHPRTPKASRTLVSTTAPWVCWKLQSFWWQKLSLHLVSFWVCSSLRQFLDPASSPHRWCTWHGPVCRSIRRSWRTSLSIGDLRMPWLAAPNSMVIFSSSWRLMALIAVIFSAMLWASVPLRYWVRRSVTDMRWISGFNTQFLQRGVWSTDCLGIHFGDTLFPTVSSVLAVSWSCALLSGLLFGFSPFLSSKPSWLWDSIC